MKYKYVKIILTAAFIIGFIFSCEIIGLGERINLDGPVVELFTPLARQPVDGKFLMTGSVQAMGNSTVSRVLVRARYNKETFPGSGVYLDTDYPSNENPLQWQYSAGSWKVSGDNGKSWHDIPGKWYGDEKKADWELPVDMTLFNNTPIDGFYQFAVTAWDNANNSDDNSYKTRTVIVNNNPPMVEIILPNTFSDNPIDENYPVFNLLSKVADTEDSVRRKIENIRHFVSGSFELMLKIDSSADVWAIDIRFYDADKTADGLWYDKAKWDSEKIMELNDNYIYRTRINPWEMTDIVPNPNDVLLPFYTLEIPDLSLVENVTGVNERPLADRRFEQLKENIKEKTNLRIVVRCIDSSGNFMDDPENVSQGFYIYWPKADLPWIEFPPTLKNTFLDESEGGNYLMYPDSVIAAKAFDNNGVDRIVYTIYRIDENGDEIYEDDETGKAFYTNDPNVINALYKESDQNVLNGLIDITQSSVFSWTFAPPSPVLSGEYKIIATVYDKKTGNAKKNDTFIGFYNVKDLSYPEIDPPETPVSYIPLFIFVKGTSPDTWYIDIEGYAYDNMEINEVTMAWINQRSVHYAAMSQLAFFQNAEYGIPPSEKNPSPPNSSTGLPAGEFGWYVAPADPSGAPGLDGGYDQKYPNLVWNMNPVSTGKEVERYGVIYKQFKYSKRIYLKDLNIAPYYMLDELGNLVKIPDNITNEQFNMAKAQDKIMDYLKSQTFVLKATDNDNKSSIITWAPQGDTNPPAITIDAVYIERYVNGVYVQNTNPEQDPGKICEYPLPRDGDPNAIPIFETNDRITIRGTWREDSATTEKLYLDPDYFINNILIPNFHVTLNTKNVTKTLTSFSPDKTSGTWEAVVLVDGGEITSGNLLDTFVVNAKLTDIGNQPSEDTGSWLMDSDKLRLVSVGSATSDGYYNENKSIDIYIDFNKPVRRASSHQYPVLTLNAQDNYGTKATAAYTTTHNDHLGLCPACENLNPNGSTRQYFKYIVGQNDNAARLQVEGITGARFENAISSGEALDITASDNINDLGRLPVTTNPAHYDWRRTLMYGSELIIDTIPPVQPSTPNLSVIPNTGYLSKGNTLWFYLSFYKGNGSDANPDDLIMIDNANPPQLLLNIRNTSTAAASKPTDSVMVNNNRLVFSCTIDEGDYSSDFQNTIGALKIVGMAGGPVTDLAGNAFVPGAGLTSANPTTISGLYIDNVKPQPPSLKMVTRDFNASNPTDIPGGDSTGSQAPWTSPPAAKDIGVLFYSTLEMAVTIPAQITGKQMQTGGYLQYSTNNGGAWVTYNGAITTPVTYIEVPSPGESTVTVRLVDRAGNYSNYANPVKFDWDNGVLLELVSTTASNGKKTYSSERKDDIPIVLEFRYPVTITAAEFTLNVGNRTSDSKPYSRVFNPFTESAPSGTENPLNKPLYEFSDGGKIWTFNYFVKPTDTTGGDRFEVKNMNITAAYLPGAGSPIDVSGMIRLSEANNKIHIDKEIYIQTGYPILEDGYPKLVTGVRGANDGYETELHIKFRTPVSRGSAGEIRIIQSETGYRLPAVLNDTLRSRYRSIIGNGIFDSFYEKGTLGYNNDTGADTATKHILKFEHDIYNVTPDGNATAGTIARLAEDFRQAERVHLQINSTAVRMLVENDGLSYGLIVDLKGTNALKVIGADYLVEFDGAIVRDEVGNPNNAYDSIMTNGGQPAGETTANTVFKSENITANIRIAEPVIRIRKPQETISVNVSPSNSQPRLVAVQPEQAEIRMDCRTPFSMVSYTTTASTAGTDTAVTWGDNYARNPPVLNTPAAAPGQPGAPTSGTNVYGSQTTAAVIPLQVGTAADANGRYTGYKYRVRAAGMTGTVPTAVYSNIYAEEIAYRTVIIFAGNNITADNGQTFASGDQMWIRGGNTKNMTTIPGFPLTWEDDYDSLEANGQRAGIRLMTRISTGATTLASSEWQWVTWNANSTIYFDLCLGKDASSSADQAFQYGPLYTAVNIGNWTPLHEYYCAFPGERRMLSSNIPSFTTQGSRQIPYTFNTSLDSRPVLGATITQ